MWVAEWNVVVFTDESRSCLQHHDGRIRNWRHLGNRMLNSCVMHRHTGPAPGIMPDGHGYELVSSVRALVPQKFSVEEELMHVKHVEVKSPHVGVMWKFGKGVISSGIVLVT
ncbi:transposable element Tcb1 transposase [Trichonephila clavipes]|nr:transposable element Tcb1 transposase [Trichonephila clavipes]